MIVSNAQRATVRTQQGRILGVPRAVTTSLYPWENCSAAAPAAVLLQYCSCAAAVLLLCCCYAAAVLLLLLCCSADVLHDDCNPAVLQLTVFVNAWLTMIGARRPNQRSTARPTRGIKLGVPLVVKRRLSNYMVKRGAEAL